MLRRLINIELAHLALLREARASGATWALIAEDDARLDDAYIFAKDLVQFITEVSPDSQPKYVNLSRSFTHDTLRLDHRLTEVGRWDAKTAVLAADKPLTNTVCSILYRVSFLDTLVPTLDSIPISPVLPIDWKLNQALLLLHSSKALGEGDCWFLDPGPIVQGSMA